jgi:hypothetical protein
MRTKCAGLCVLVVALTTFVLFSYSFSIDQEIYRIKDDFGADPLYDCRLSYYYDVPCPTESYFWGFKGWNYGDIVGQFFIIGDQGTGLAGGCDPAICQRLEKIKYLDLNEYAPGIHPTDFVFEWKIHCSDLNGCPVGPALWTNSWSFSWNYGWNYADITPPLCLTPCLGGPYGGPVILITAKHLGDFSDYGPEWGTDAPGLYYYYDCSQHDIGCLPILYPRPWISHFDPGIHSGYFGNQEITCPPSVLCDKYDSTPDCNRYGACELAWTIYLICDGPTDVGSPTWGSIKAMYR